MAQPDLNVQLLLSAIDRMSPVVAAAAQKLNASLGGLKTLKAKAGLDLVAPALGNVAGKMTRVVEAALPLVTGGGLLGGLGLGALAKGVVDTGAQFERLRATLTTIEGSFEKAKASLAWVSGFAAKTPFELEEVSQAFVRLKAYGIDPIAGDGLRKIGDAASALGKPLMQAVEAVADAVNGENERLKEFGITAAKTGDTITYSWVENGKTLTRTVKATNKQLIADTLFAIWNAKYRGQMDTMSRTWEGMTSNLRDAWKGFKLAIADAGFFDYLKDKLKALLDLVDRMAADGSLARLAKRISGDLVAGLEGLATTARSVWRGLSDLRDLFGSWTPLLAAAAAVIAGPLIASLVALGGALLTLGATLTATPFGWAVIAVGALAVAGTALYLKWDWVAARLRELWDELATFADVSLGLATDVAKALGDVAGWIGEKWDQLLAKIVGVFAQIQAKAAALASSLPGWLGGEGRALPNAVPLSEWHKRREVPSAFPPPKAGGEGRAVIEFRNAPAGMVLKQLASPPGFGLDVDLGLSHGARR